MSVDLNFWRYKKDVYFDNAVVYQTACCDHETVEGLETLPIEDILREIAAAFQDWNALDLFNYERIGECGSFQITTTSQTLRVDCYGMEQEDMKRFSSILSEFGCPLYDPQLGVRFDKIVVFFSGEVSEYQTLVEDELSRLLPRLETITQVVDWEEYLRLSKELPHIQFDASIHRTKTLTKVTSFMKFGSAWANRACQCKTAQLEDKNEAPKRLAELLKTSISRVVNDFFERTYYK